MRVAEIVAARIAREQRLALGIQFGDDMGRAGGP